MEKKLGSRIVRAEGEEKAMEEYKASSLPPGLWLG